ncbi:UNVERIFIED_CONTAM: PXMP2/4 family protein 4 [Trichonephila clavipes]
MMVSGSIFGVAGHYWYQFLDRKFPGTTVRHVAKKLLLEMAIGPPVFFGFFLAIGYLEGKPVKSSVEEFKKNALVICAVSNNLTQQSPMSPISHVCYAAIMCFVL